jgi:hypothetical protein
MLSHPRLQTLSADLLGCRRFKANLLIVTAVPL